MADSTLILLSGAVLVVAFLYSSVGHAGASGYIAVMTLAGLAPGTIKPAALVLNVLVASIASLQFGRAGYFSWARLWPFALTAVPMAFLGGYVTLPARAFHVLVGLVLLASARRFLWRPAPDTDAHAPRPTIALPVGAGIGLLAGLTGTGGGIFLTPLLILMKWARTKEAAATSAVFILANSIAGLAGHVSATGQVPLFALPLAIAAAAGGALGSHLGSRKFDAVMVKQLLAVVLTIAGAKLLFT